MLRYMSLIGTSIGRLGVASSGAPESWYRVSNDKAMFQGKATINGGGDTYTFHATDGHLTGDEPEAFRITIGVGPPEHPQAGL